MTDYNLPQSLNYYIHSTLPFMEGWCSQNKAAALARAVLDQKPKLAVEIGVFAGRSLFAIALAMRQNGNDGRVLGIDPWEAAASIKGFEKDDVNSTWWAEVDHQKIYNQCRLCVNSMGLQGQVLLARTTSEVAVGILQVSEYLQAGPIIDFLHIDGNHSELQSVADVTSYLPLVRTGGVVVFDDTNWESTKKAQELLTAECDFSHFVEQEGQQCGFYRKHPELKLTTNQLLDHSRIVKA